ncbi:MAG TPA: hypothetical protein VND64_04235 [Pirellulales bacterium]|nr:hypothetical protein [Pirellulales bacterium]
MRNRQRLTITPEVRCAARHCPYLAVIVEAILLIAGCGGAAAADVAIQVPFDKLRQFLPADGDVIEVFRNKNVWPNEAGDDKDEWFQLGVGKDLKARSRDRTAENEKVFGRGVYAENGRLYVVAGWRGRKKGVEEHFDGRLKAAFFVAYAAGRWDVAIDRVDVQWNTVLPFNIVGPMVEDQIHRYSSALADLLNDAFVEKVGTAAGNPALAAIGFDKLSASLIDDKLVIGDHVVKPLLALGDIKDRKGHRSLRTVREIAERLKIGIVDQANLDAGATTVSSLIEVQDKIDGASDVRLNAPGGRVVFKGKIDGASHVEVSAPGGTVEFEEEINGRSHVDIIAKTVVFKKKIDCGGNNPTIITITISPGGSIRFSELYATLQWRKSAGADPQPEIVRGKVAYDGKVVQLP